MSFRLKKAVKLGCLLVVLCLAYISLLTMYPSSQRNNSSGTLLQNFERFFKKLGFGRFNFEDGQDFQKHLHEITIQKINDNSTRSLYFLRPDYLAATKVLAPVYFEAHDGIHKKPLVQPFDPRFTLAIYFEWIRKNPGKPVPFHWSDWVDLSLLYKYILLPDREKETCQGIFHLNEKQKKKSTILPVDDYCTDVQGYPLGFKVTRFPEAHSRENAKLLAKSYIYSSFPVPSLLVFLTNSNGAYHIETDGSGSNLEHSLLQNGMPEMILESRDSKQLDVLEAYKSLLATQNPNVARQEEPTQIHLDESWFNFDANATILDLEKLERSQNEENYLLSLKSSINIQAPEKSFMEAKILASDSKSLLGNHYDWRFFDGLIVDTERHALSLNKILKTYLHFCRSHGLVTWIAHGTLLSWYWNGMIFPWDDDIDVQMPLRDLNRLARTFNQSMVVENVGLDFPGSTDIEFNGMGGFFIDVGTSITHRERENGLNNIDARFIDVQTGLYVDITGLAVSDERAPVRYKKPIQVKSNHRDNRLNNKVDGLFNCRNRHFNSLDELTPLVKTVIEDEVGYVPQKFSPILQHEYSSASLLEHKFNDYYYLDSLRLWAKTKVLREYVKDPIAWVQNQQGQSKSDHKSKVNVKDKDIAHLTEDDLKNLLLDNHILADFWSSRNFTRFHEKQMQNLFTSNMKKYFSNLKEYLTEEQLHQPLWKDFFMTKVALDGWNYEEEVRKLNDLTSIYEQE